MVRHCPLQWQATRERADDNSGRAWTVNELRNRDWETLQQLWWVCVKERNRLATAHYEHRRQGAGYGRTEMEERDETIQKTMKAILDTLAERNTAYGEAYKLAKHDPTIDLDRPGYQYQEPSYDAEVSLRHTFF
jgi:large subunit ribosomal protein L47